MSTRLTISDLERLKTEGKIQGYVDSRKLKVKNSKLKVQKGSKIKGWIELNLKYWCQAKGLTLLKEHRFDKVRKWRFDFAIEEKKIAIEYNGIMSEKSRHTTIGGYSGDMDKVTQASIMGWTILQYTPLNFKNLINDLEKTI
jgi:very-short-patch-repair endonuclease